MKGFIFRLGVNLKNAGDKTGLVFLIRLGTAISDHVRHTAKKCEMY